MEANVRNFTTPMTKMIFETTTEDTTFENGLLSDLWVLNGAVKVLETSLSSPGLLHLGGIGAVSLATILGIVSSCEILTRSTFVYYLKYHAPKERDINRLMMQDQVNSFYFKSGI